MIGDSPLVVAWGGGVNSTAMLIGMKDRGMSPDLILFADTGGEKPETYVYRDYFNNWLNAIGFPPLTVVSAAKKYDSLETQCLTLGVLPSIAYGWKTCSQRWKGEPQDKFVGHWHPARDAWAAGWKVIKAIGYDAGEPHRAKPYSDEKFDVIYPLVEWDWGRDECLDAIARAGIEPPPKSACFYCPSSKKHEIIQLHIEHPELAKRAFAMESGAEGTNRTVQGLGRHWSWTDLIARYEAGEIDGKGKAIAKPSCGTDRQLPLFTDPDDAPCGCFDGDGNSLN